MAAFSFSFLPSFPPKQRLCDAERSKAQGWQPPTGFTIDRELSRAAAEHADFPSCQLLPSATSLPSSCPGTSSRVLTGARRYRGGRD